MNHICDDPTLTDAEKWHKLYGTDIQGSLSQYKATQHKGKSFSPCPYSTQAPDLRTRHMLNLTMSGTLPLKVDHTGSDNILYYMKTAVRGDWGYECTFSGCPYLLSTGFPYFYR
ncbi:hypothetical protein JZU46_06910 [bacterium]|nr:hypothetical protein [bacterium]